MDKNRDFEARKNVKRIEKKIERCEARKSEIHAAFNEEGIELEKISKLSAELNGINTDLELLEGQWLEAMESIEEK